MKANCPYCDAEVITETGRRPKKFCSAKCRTKFWQKKKAGNNSHYEDPVEVKFDIRFIEHIRREIPIIGDHPQAVLNYLIGIFWEHNHQENQNKTNTDHSVEDKVDVLKEEEKTATVKSDGENEPPEGLSGIALMVWRNEQKLKAKKQKK